MTSSTTVVVKEKMKLYVVGGNVDGSSRTPVIVC